MTDTKIPRTGTLTSLHRFYLISAAFRAKDFSLCMPSREGGLMIKQANYILNHNPNRKLSHNMRLQDDDDEWVGLDWDQFIFSFS